MVSLETSNEMQWQEECVKETHTEREKEGEGEREGRRQG